MSLTSETVCWDCLLGLIQHVFCYIYVLINTYIHIITYYIHNPLTIILIVFEWNINTNHIWKTNSKLNMCSILNAYHIFWTSKYFMDNHNVISSLFYSYYFSHGKSNLWQTLMLTQLTTCVGPGCRTRPWVLSPGCRTTSSWFETQWGMHHWRALTRAKLESGVSCV